MIRSSVVFSLALLAVDLAGCSEAQTPHPETAQAAPRRRRRPRNAAPAAEPAAAPATVAAATAVGASEAPPADAPPPAAHTLNGALVARPAPDTGGFGTPIVHHAAAAQATARWVTDSARPRIVCDATPNAQIPSSQSPWEPTNAMTVRAFQPVESQVLACRPPADANGRFAITGRFSGGGVPQEFFFPEGVRLSASRARCLGEALCQTRMPAFRAGSAAVNYDYVVLISE